MSKVMVCSNCEDVPLIRNKGSFVVEVLLWLFFIIPGVIYSLWRSKEICSECKGDYLVPANSPKGKKILEAINPEESKTKTAKQLRQRARKNIIRVIFAILIVFVFSRIFG